MVEHYPVYLAFRLKFYKQWQFKFRCKITVHLVMFTYSLKQFMTGSKKIYRKTTHFQEISNINWVFLREQFITICTKNTHEIK